MQRKLWPVSLQERRALDIESLELSSVHTLLGSFLRSDFPLPSSLQTLEVDAESPWALVEHLCTLRTGGKLPKLEKLYVWDIDTDNPPWVPLQNPSAVTSLLGLCTLNLPDYKACSRLARFLARLQRIDLASAILPSHFVYATYE